MVVKFRILDRPRRRRYGDRQDGRSVVALRTDQAGTGACIPYAPLKPGVGLEQIEQV